MQIREIDGYRWIQDVTNPQKGYWESPFPYRERSRSDWEALGVVFGKEEDQGECVFQDGQLVRFVPSREPDDVSWDQDEFGNLKDPRAALFEAQSALEALKNPDGCDPRTKIEPIFRETPLTPEQIANLVLVGKYDPKKDPDVFEPMKILTGYRARKPKARITPALPLQQANEIMSARNANIERNLKDLQIVREPYPVFPRWVFENTSLFDGLVKPVCDANRSRIPEFMFLPAIVLFLNALGTRVRIEGTNHSLSFFLVTVGRRGQTKKSSSLEDAIHYFKVANLVGDSKSSTSNADGKSILIGAGSAEGMGTEVNRLNCKNFVLCEDELTKITNKCGIDGSSLTSFLVSMYESAKLQNITKSPKHSYSLVAGEYVASMITCSTDNNFEMNWSRLCADSSGLDDRTFFLMAPEFLPEPDIYTHVNTDLAAMRTRDLIANAINQEVYKIADKEPLRRFLKANPDHDRLEIRAEKLALYFCVDLGKREIDADCLRRALAVVEYEKAVKTMLPRFEAYTKQGILQQRMLHEIRRLPNCGSISVRDFEHNLHPERYGTSEWDRALHGLISNKWIAEQGSGVKGDPVRLVLQKDVSTQD